MRRSLALLVAAMFAASAGVAAERTTVVDASRGAADGTIAVESVDHRQGHVTAVVRNTSPRPVSDLRLLVQLVYQWPRETQPGDASPSRASVVRIPGPLAPGASARVDETLGALGANATGGSFEPRVEVVSFVTEGG